MHPDTLALIMTSVSSSIAALRDAYFNFQPCVLLCDVIGPYSPYMFCVFGPKPPLHVLYSTLRHCLAPVIFSLFSHFSFVLRGYIFLFCVGRSDGLYEGGKEGKEET